MWEGPDIARRFVHHRDDDTRPFAAVDARRVADIPSRDTEIAGTRAIDDPRLDVLDPPLGTADAGFVLTPWCPLARSRGFSIST